MEERKEETGIPVPKGMKNLWDNLKKRENSEKNNNDTQLIANLKNKKSH